jgi:hypothetical protein
LEESSRQIANPANAKLFLTPDHYFQLSGNLLGESRNTDAECNQKAWQRSPDVGSLFVKLRDHNDWI